MTQKKNNCCLDTKCLGHTNPVCSLYDTVPPLQEVVFWEGGLRDRSPLHGSSKALATPYALL